MGVALAFAYEVLRESGAAPLSPAQTISFPDTALTNKAGVTIRVRNAGTADAKITDAAVLGAAFQLADTPFFPLTLRPGEAATVTVAFAPPQPGVATGRLRIGNDSFALSGAGIGAALTFAYSTGGTQISVPPGGTVPAPDTVPMAPLVNRTLMAS